MPDDRKIALEEAVRRRTVEMRRLSEDQARDIKELREYHYHDPATWLTFLATLMPPPS